MKKCYRCEIEKEENLFKRVKGEKFSNLCKACHAADNRTGKPNTGRFKKGVIPLTCWKKGNIPWNKGKKGSIPWNKDKEPTGNSRGNNRVKIWKKLIHEKDDWKCVKCGCCENLHAHHIKPWKDFEELRFDVNNGMTLCNSCHAKEEGYKKGHKPSQEVIDKIRQANKGKDTWNKGKKLSEEHIQKLRDSHKGQIPWNKNKKMNNNR